LRALFEKGANKEMNILLHKITKIGVFGFIIFLNFNNFAYASYLEELDLEQYSTGKENPDGMINLLNTYLYYAMYLIPALGILMVAFNLLTMITNPGKKEASREQAMTILKATIFITVLISVIKWLSGFFIP
jgi:hypothetical protein